MFLDPNGLYYTYLRKSREDRDAEARGEGETLARHAKRLNELASQLGIQISKVYKEVVSGDTIACRPEMLRLLSDIEEYHPDGVLVVEIERLARGDTRDQGLIMETFKYGNTKIITPMKTYDPNDESDEEYAEFGLFMSRREYKVINRRLQNGRRASINEGKWIGNKAPYGYERIKIPHDKGFTLTPLPGEAETVRFIFQLFTVGAPESNNITIGTAQIARLLDDLKVKPRFSDTWEPCVIRSILRNYAYIGKLQVGKRKQVKTIINGEVKKTRPINHNSEIKDAIHPPIIDEETFFKAQAKLDANYKPPFYTTIKAPLAGLIYCSVCGKSMFRRPVNDRCKADSILCKTHNCPTVGSFYYLVEDRLIQFLEQCLQDYKVKIRDDETGDWTEVLERKKAVLKEYIDESQALQDQQNNIYDYFERKLYSVELFQKRMNDIKDKISTNLTDIENIKNDIKVIESKIIRKEDFLPFFENIMDSYKKTDDPLLKNALLKQIVDHVMYAKTKRGTSLGHGIDAFTLDVYLKLPYDGLTQNLHQELQ